jgi:hypothetical protein
MTLSWKLEGSSLVADELFLSGARRLQINLGQDFASCRLGVIYGKEASNENIRYFARHGHEEIEPPSVKVTSASCRIIKGLAGPAFAGEDPQCLHTGVKDKEWVHDCACRVKLGGYLKPAGGNTWKAYISNKVVMSPEFAACLKEPH